MNRFERREQLQALLDDLIWWIVTHCDGEVPTIFWAVRIRERIEQIFDKDAGPDGT